MLRTQDWRDFSEIKTNAKFLLSWLPQPKIKLNCAWRKSKSKKQRNRNGVNEYEKESFREREIERESCAPQHQPVAHKLQTTEQNEFGFGFFNSFRSFSYRSLAKYAHIALITKIHFAIGKKCFRLLSSVRLSMTTTTTMMTRWRWVADASYRTIYIAHFAIHYSPNEFLL